MRQFSYNGAGSLYTAIILSATTFKNNAITLEEFKSDILSIFKDQEITLNDRNKFLLNLQDDDSGTINTEVFNLIKVDLMQISIG